MAMSQIVSHSQCALSKRIMELASEIDAFSYDYDPYGYTDMVDDKESNILGIAESLESGAEAEINYLNEVVNDWQDDNDPVIAWAPKLAKMLLGRIDEVLNTMKEVQTA